MPPPFTLTMVVNLAIIVILLELLWLAAYRRDLIWSALAGLFLIAALRAALAGLEIAVVLGLSGALVAHLADLRGRMSSGR